MNYNIKGTGLSITPESRDYVERRLGRLEGLLRDKDGARFDIELEYKESEEKMYRAEVMLGDPKLHRPLRAQARAATLHEAIDMVEDELFHELSRGKQKRLHHIRQGAKRAKDFLRGFRRE